MKSLILKAYSSNHYKIT